jgi:hypothetical protein
MSLYKNLPMVTFTTLLQKPFQAKKKWLYNSKITTFEEEPKNFAISPFTGNVEVERRLFK